MPVKKSMRAKKPASSSKKAAMPQPPAAAPSGKPPVRWMRTFGAETIFIALMCVMAAAMLIAAAHGTSDTTERPRVAVEPDAVLPQPQPAVASAGVSASDVTEPESVGTTARMTTVSGCLERSDDTFRLKDTSGADAPKARSWKSGFLRKSAASIDVVDTTHRLRLSNHVGHRVSLTGTLEERSMQARSLQRIAGSCK